VRRELSLTFLGTAGAVPTPSRGLSSTLVARGGERFLVDCGEGTQRQLIKAAVGITQIQRILLTHLHADHYLGLPGLLKTWDLWGRPEPAEVYGPRGLYDLVEALRRVIGRISFPVEWRELAPGERLAFAGYRVEAVATEHRVPSLGYAFCEDPRPGRFDPGAAVALGVPEGPAWRRLQHGEAFTGPDGREVRPDDVMGTSRPGRKVVVTGDTRPCEAVIRAAKDCDCLVHDATFTSAEQARAAETSHSTAGEAGRVARKAGAKLLVLTHLSFRHMPREIQAEARAVFDNCVVPADFDRVLVPFPEKGPPQLLKPTLTDADAARAMPVPAKSFEL
jgi:ribonuclease Z